MPRRLLTWCLASVLFFAAFAVPRAETPAAPKPNYDLAANWTAQKVGRLVFDTTVTPRWLESGDRFWYPYQTREGRKFYLVDPIKRTKAPLFDHAKMAATLTSMTREPYDAQHLPFTTVKFVRKDAAFQFDVQVPRDADVAKPRKPVNTTDAQAAARQGGQDPSDDDAVDPQQQGQRGRGGASGRGAATAANADAALRVRHGDRQRRPPRATTRRDAAAAVGGAVAGRQDDRVRPQPQPVHDGRRQLRAGAKEGRRRGHQGNAADEGRRGALQLRAVGAAAAAGAGTAAATTAGTRRAAAAQRPTRMRQPTRTRGSRRCRSSGRETRRSSRSSAAISGKSRTSG